MSLGCTMEAADSPTNSSKVIVNCHDPSGLFGQVLPKLETRLPLTKLHWKSPNRPLRSIEQLDVSFVRDESSTDSTANTRRHQIPGLRQTPFVKIYLLRCDDREAYKETCRKEVKQWLKAQGVSQDGKTLGKGQERHDAFEYIILHVVLPGTPAAAQPKSSKHISIEASESTDSLNSRSKWTGKSSSTIFDKLRADFSSSSKAPFERVAQIRVGDLEARPASGMSQSDIEEQWQDLTEKLKTAILQSFDARVAQYEDDIRDRENQRHLPGWNFCTFFVLKEGLARGFGNVGLLDDAMAVYGELDAGLDTLLQDQAASKESDPTGALLPFSNDLKPAIRSVLDSSNLSSDSELFTTEDRYFSTAIDLARDDFPFDVEKRGYQQRILTNQVSPLDLRIYIFTQQIQLMFRQASTILHSSTSKPSAATAGLPYDLNILSDVCEKATEFINFATRMLRQDLYRAWGGQEGLNQEDLTMQHKVIGGIVASWKWSALMQIFTECHIPSLLGGQSMSFSGNDDNMSNGHSKSSSQTNGNTAMQNQLFALWTAELLVMARDTLYDLRVPSGDDADDYLSVPEARKLRSLSLGTILRSNHVVSGVLKMLTTHAFWCFEAAGQKNSSRSMLYTLAQNEFENDNVDQAVSWLELVPGLNSLNASTATDRRLLVVYAKCLKAQQKYDHYARALVSILLGSAESPIARASLQRHEESQHLLEELVNVSENISRVELPLSGFITLKSVSKSISHDKLADGFKLTLKLALQFDAAIEISRISLTLTSLEELDPSEIVLTNKTTVNLSSDVTSVDLESHINVNGLYNVQKLNIDIGEIILNHDFPAQLANEERTDSLNQLKPDPVTIYPHAQSPSVVVRSSTTVDLTQSERLMVEISGYGNLIEECTLRIRPATAGFRLDLQAAQIQKEKQWEICQTTSGEESNDLFIQQILPDRTEVIEIPFSTESTATVSSVKIECRYRIHKECFSIFSIHSVFISLPININVQDIFQSTKIFSRFSAAPSTSHPLKLLNWTIEDDAASIVKTSSSANGPLDIFNKMPATWMVELKSRESHSRARARFGLVVEYQTYDDIIISEIERQFRNDIRTSSVASVTNLLLPHVLAKISTNWTEQDLETAVLVQAFQLMSFEQMMWNDVTRALDKQLQFEVNEWLRSWHSQHMWFGLTSKDAAKRMVKISVEVPRPSLIVSTSLVLAGPKPRFLTLGKPRSAKLSIQKSQMNSDVEISYEVTSHSDAWLIGGKKRGATESATDRSVVDILLIAQKSGHVLLPAVNIQCRRKTSDEAESVEFEVEHRSQAKSVFVIPNLDATTVAVGMEQTSSRYLTLNGRPRSAFS